MWHTGPFVFVTRLLSTLLMCFQDAVTDFSLKAEIHPNYSHCEVSSVVKTFSHGVSTVTYILITHLPESCSQSAAHCQQLFVQKVHYVYCVCVYTRVCVCVCIMNLSVSWQEWRVSVYLLVSVHVTWQLVQVITHFRLLHACTFKNITVSILTSLYVTPTGLINVNNLHAVQVDLYSPPWFHFSHVCLSLMSLILSAHVWSMTGAK